MATAIPNPDPQVLIPPLLAILPTSFASAKPPPAALELLSPILQQRLQIHTSTPGTQHDSWLRLLCWDKTKAERVKEIVENANFEPHPVSGDVETGDVGKITYRRFDAETLRAQIPLPDWELTAVYVWCTGGEAGDTWKLAELLPFDSDLGADADWSQALEQVDNRPASARPSLAQRKISIQSEDDGYWAMYDGSPGQTPARQGSINPQLAGVSEEDYYAQYADVQPALDNHDPDEAPADVGETSLKGDALQQLTRSMVGGGSLGDRSVGVDEEDVVHVSHPVPSSPSSRAGSDTVSRLEESAERYTASDIAIRQHISTSVKSMYRLAKAAGISSSEFSAMVQRELETLSIFDAHD